MLRLSKVTKSLSLGIPTRPINRCFSNNSAKSDYWRLKGTPNPPLDALEMKGVTIVRSKEDAERVVKVLEENKNRVVAWDTETLDIEVKEQSPVGNGNIICFSGFAGPDIDFGNGPRLIVDNFGERHELVQTFKEYFEDNDYLKSWFNYGFDRHIFYNHGIDVRGFGGDSMHMARLLDPTRGPKSYSLANLTSYYTNEMVNIKTQIIDNMLKEKKLSDSRRDTLKVYQENFMQDHIKTGMSKIFQRRKRLANGELGKTIEMPSILELHTSPEFVANWISYSALDAETTFFLREVLTKELTKFGVRFEGMKNLFDLYVKYWLPFGEILTNIEREGIRVDLNHLSKAEQKATEDLNKLEAKFIDWVKMIQPEAKDFNPGSTQQLQQLLYAPFKRTAVQKAKNLNEDELEVFTRDFAGQEETAEEDSMKSTVKKPRNIDQAMTFPEVREFKVPNLDGEIFEGQKKPLKHKMMKIKGLGIKPEILSASGLPSVDVNALSYLVGNPEKGKYGAAYQHFE